MKKLLTILLIAISISATAQAKKDTTQPKVNQDSLYTFKVLNDFGAFIYSNDKMPAKVFDILKKTMQDYIDDKMKSWKK